MRIMLVNNSLTLTGGAEYLVVMSARALVQAGHEVIMVGEPRDGYTPTSLKGAVVHSFPSVWLLTPGSGGEHLDRFRGILGDEAPDLIHIHNVRNLLVQEAANQLRPTVRSFHDANALCVGDSAKYLHTREKVCPYPIGWRCVANAYLERCTFRRPLRLASSYRRKARDLELHRRLSMVIVHSRYMESVLLGNGIEKTRIATIPCFVSDTPREPVEHPNPQSILYVGNILWTKGLDLLIAALRGVRSPYHLLVAGDGSQASEMRELARRHLGPDRVTFLGFVENERLQKYYAEAAFLVLPSRGAEAFGIVGIEAMSHARPVVAFDVGGVSDWLVDGLTGYLVPEQDIELMGKRITSLLDDPGLARRMGQAGQTRTRTLYPLQEHMRQLVGVYQKTMRAWEEAKAR